MTYRKRIDSGASEDRLEKLVGDRLKPGANREAIDRRIWDLFGEEWAIMFTDLSGFSRNVERFGIIHFLQTIYESERLLVPIIEDHDGILLKIEGDSFLVIFRNPMRSIVCSIAMQKELEKYNLDKAPEDKVLLCVGLGFGRVLKIGDEDVFGSEVNAASKLGEDTAKAGEILVTQGIVDRAGDQIPFPVTKLAETPSGASAAYRLEYRS